MRGDGEKTNECRNKDDDAAVLSAYKVGVSCWNNETLYSTGSSSN